MGFEHDRIKANARKFYSLNNINSILVYLIYIGITIGISVVSVIIPGIGTLAAMFFVMLPLQLGFIVWFYRAIYTEKLEVNAIFFPFGKDYMGFVGTVTLKYLYIFLWSLLFYIPGIVKTYSYMMTEYIKAENPNIPASRAIELSMIMTDGYKWKLFYLTLSFLGWSLLGAFTFGILNVVYVIPYMNASFAFAYDELKANAIATGRISANELNGSNNQ